MPHGATAIRIVHRREPDMDFERIVAQLNAMPGVETAAVVWQNETLDETDEYLLEQAKAQRKENQARKRRLTR